MPPKNIPALDGVRGIAILIVMAYHFTDLLSPLTGPGKAVQLAASLGWSGVDMFFVLSGFLITGILLRARGSAGYFRNFYMRRVLRIFPLYYGVLFTLFIVVPNILKGDPLHIAELQSRQVWLWAYASNIYIAIHGEWLFNVGWGQLNHLWSLAVEEHFYLVWPFLVGLLTRRALLRACVAMLIGAPLLRLVLLFLNVPRVASYVLSPCRMDALALGGLLAVLVTDEEILTKLGRAAWPAFLGGLSFTIAIQLVRHNSDHQGWPVQLLGFPALALAYAGLLIIAYQSRPGALAHRVFTARALMTAGKYSYAGYVLHQLLRPAFGRLWPPDRFSPLPEWIGILLHVALSIGFSLGAACLTWHLFEKHFLELKRYFEYTKPASKPPSPTRAA